MANYSKFLEIMSGVARTVDLSQASNILELGGGGLQMDGSTSGHVVISASATTTTYSMIWPSAQAASSGYVLTNDGTGHLSWTAPAATGVTSVGLVDGDASSIFNITNSPITSSGNISLALANQSAHTILAGPTSGSAAQPSFRLLVSADIPNNAANTTGSAGSVSVLTTAGDILYENSTPANARLPIGTSGQVLTVVGGLPSWQSVASTAVSVQNTVYVSKNGNDSTGTGSLSAPYLTVSAAMASITTATDTNVFMIKCGPGVYSVSGLAFKHDVILSGSSSVSNANTALTNNVALTTFDFGNSGVSFDSSGSEADAIFAITDAAILSSTTSTVNINSYGTNLTTATQNIVLKNITMFYPSSNNDQTLNVNVGAASIVFDSCRIFSQNITIYGGLGAGPSYVGTFTAYNTYFESSTGISQPLVIGGTSVPHPFTAVFNSCVIAGDTLVASNSGATSNIYFISTPILGSFEDDITPASGSSSNIYFTGNSLPVKGSISFVGSGSASDLKRLNDAYGTGYTPTTSANWSSVPNNISDALDELAVPFATQSANTFWAGPSSGSAARPSFRSIVAADLPAGTGTVTSVAFSDASTTPIYAISGSPVTSSGTLTQTLNTQSANLVFAGPSSGSAAQPSFRSLVANDIPSLSAIYLPLAGGTMSGAINMGAHQINNVGAPSASTDAATKGYVDSAINGLEWKGPVQAYANSNVALTGGASLTIDGYSVQNGDYVILAAQTTASQNYVYVASGIGTAYTLTQVTGSEAPTAIGDAYLIEKGTAFGNTAFQVNAISPNVTFIQFAGPNTYTFSSPLSLSGNVVSLNLGNGVTTTGGNLVASLAASGALAFSSGAIAAQVDGSTITINGSNQLNVPSSGIGTSQLANASVTLAKMANLAANSIIGNNTGSSAAPVALSQAQVTAFLNQFSATLQGVVPASGGGTSNFLRADGTWAAPAGSVTSVALADSTNLFNITGSPVTSSGTLTLSSFKNQSQNAVFAGPSSGGAGAPSFRALVSSDIPALSYVTSVAMSVPAFLSVSGSPITSSGTLAVSLSGTALPVANGGTGVTSVTTSPTVSAFAGWDANKNLSANNHIEGYSTTATAAGTTTLTVGSTYLQYFTGSTTQTVKMPVTTTLVLGQQFQIVNNSTGAVAVQSNGGSAIQSMAGGSSILLTVINASADGASSWSFVYTPVAAGSSGTVTSVAMSVPAFLSVSGSPITSSGTLAVSFSGTALPVANGGTGTTTSTGSGSVVLSAAPAITGAWTLTDAGTIVNAATTTKVLAFSLSGMTAAKTLTLSSSQSTTQTLTIPNITSADTLATLGLGQTFSGSNTFSSALTLSAATNQLKLGTTNVLTISSAQTASETLTIPNITTADTLVTQAFTQTLTNKTIAAGSNTISGLTNSNLSGSAGITGANIATNTVANTNLAQMATLTIKGNNSGVTANAADLTVAQVNAILPVFTPSLNGLAPLSGGGTTNFLRADGTWAAPAGSVLSTSETSDQALTASTLYALRYALSTDSGSTAGRMWKADNNAATTDNFYVIGLAYPGSSVSVGGAVTVVEQGLINVPSHGFTTGLPLYLGTSGACTTTAPTSSQTAIVKVGQVKDANNIWVNVQVMGVN